MMFFPHPEGSSVRSLSFYNVQRLRSSWSSPRSGGHHVAQRDLTYPYTQDARNMAAVLSETITESTHFPKMRRGGDEHQRSPISSQYQSASRQRGHVPPSPRPRPTNTIPQQIATTTHEPVSDTRPTLEGRQSFASQQNFSSSSHNQHQGSRSHVGYHADDNEHPQSAPRVTPHLASPAPSATSPLARSTWSSDDLSRYGGRTVKVRDLAHIQSFASESFLSHRGESERRRAEGDPPLKYEISSMPISDIIEMVAGLLTKITTTNDRQHENLHRPIPSAESAASMPGLTSSVLAFHGKNVPSITILSYLSRIHKYCPTTYEVFLSLLVYFDRMTERVNAAPLQELQRNSSARNSSRPSTASATSEEMEMATSPVEPSSAEEINRPQLATPPDDEQLSYNLSHFFVVDSFNIHRLVIAGVTCASKFFSDVFYTNSRYAKVGGLPLPELNHLELQFLLLNDFRLSVPVEELEAYGTMLVEFYAREVIAQRQASATPADMAYSDDIPMTTPSSP